MIKEFIFSGGYFLVVLFIFYKKFLPIIKNQVYIFIQSKKNYRHNLLKNLEQYEKEYQSQQQKIEDLKNEIIFLKEQEEKLKNNCQIKIKTMKYNSDIQRKKQKESIYNFYRTKAIHRWFHTNKQEIIDLIKANKDFNKKISLPKKLSKTNKNSNKFTLDVLNTVDEW